MEEPATTTHATFVAAFPLAARLDEIGSFDEWLEMMGIISCYAKHAFQEGRKRVG